MSRRRAAFCVRVCVPRLFVCVSWHQILVGGLGRSVVASKFFNRLKMDVIKTLISHSNPWLLG